MNDVSTGSLDRFPPSALESGLQLIGRWDVLPYRFRKNFIRRFIDDRTVASRPFEIAFDGLSYTGNLNSFIDWSIFFLGAYEKHILAFMARVAGQRPGCVFVDVGANMGQHSLFMSRRAARVHAVEPWREAVTTLRAQLAANRIENVTVHPCALGEENRLAKYYPPAGTNRGTGSFVASFAPDQAGDPVEYPVRIGAGFIEAEVGRVDLIKIDTEGYETHVIRGLNASLERYRPCVVMEIAHHTEDGFRDLAALRDAFPEDYRLFGIRGIHNGYRYRLCELTDANWCEFLDVVALPADAANGFSSLVRSYPFYSKPGDIPRILRALAASGG